VPIPVFESFEALNAYLLECCRQRLMEYSSADEVATAVRNAIARGSNRLRCTSGHDAAPVSRPMYVLADRHRHMGPRQIRIDRHVEARRSTFRCGTAPGALLPYDACEKVPTSVSSLSLVRYRLNDTRRRRLTVTATCLCAIASMTW